MANYQWTGAGDGKTWSSATNWNNTTAGENPALTAPGSGDDVEFQISATLTTGDSALSVTVQASSSPILVTFNGASLTTTDFTEIGETGTNASVLMFEAGGTGSFSSSANN